MTLEGPPQPPTTLAALAASFTSFLTVAIHQILYLRSVYPRATFLPVRAYNYPTRQSRHPKVCEYINDVAAAVETEIRKGTVATVSVIILSLRTNQPMERYAFDLSRFPRVASEQDLHTPFEERQEGQGEEQPKPSADMVAQFRACLVRLASACARLSPLPKNQDGDDEFGFTVCIELRDEAPPPVGSSQEEQAWIAAESSNSSTAEGASGRAKTVPVRRVEAGEMRLEMWVEEARQKFDVAA
ncbi:hypothetical protein VTN31DRAFT_6379 [Thermomyces dupontii]|uniref:uncharacterized protein n=1 Tax=Talaromyces thermophilus TaxID=28565 RepID=UPI0037421371